MVAINEDNLLCPLCGETFSVRNNLRERHMIPDTRFPCPWGGGAHYQQQWALNEK
jgi:5-methylcytosine-specific restriction endonuclease McrA